MAELTHEQLWKVCQRKPGDFELYMRGGLIENERHPNLSLGTQGAL